MADESKLEDTATKQKTTKEVIEESKTTSSTNPLVESENDEEQENTPTAGTAASGATAKKKKSKKKRIKAALTGGSGESSGSSSKDEISRAVSGLSKAQVSELLAMNPALAQQLGVDNGDLSGSKAMEAMKRLNLEDIMTGLAANGKNVKDMASYKFWQTQPVPKFGDNTEEIEEGPFKIVDLEQVPKEPGPLVDGFEWVTMDILNDAELKEVWELLNGHYVEDEEAMFRFNYSISFLKW
jgi:glycylpeptide N-tetradecanoyltransferase